MQKWTDPSDVERQFNPTHWGYTLSNPDKAYAASCPTLAAYDRLYGEGCAEDWVCTQITVLFAASSSREKGLADGIRLFSSAFAAEVRQYKLSELMLFFARYKSGKYDNSYASFDAKRIGNAFFKEFLKERVHEIDRVQGCSRRSRTVALPHRKGIRPFPGIRSLKDVPNREIQKRPHSYRALVFNFRINEL